MFLYSDDLAEEFGDDIVNVSPLQELSQELLEESIKEQVKDPFSSRTDFLEEFGDMYDDDLDGYSNSGNDDMVEETKQVANNFYRKVIDIVDKKFDLKIDHNLLEDVNTEGLRNLAEGLYSFFIVKYSSNIAKYITALIMEYKDELIDRFKDDSETDTVSRVSFERKIKDVEVLPLFTHINSAIASVRSMEVNADEFISYFNTEKFEVAVLEYAITNFIITGNFVPRFLDPVFKSDVQNDVYDNIVITVAQKLFNKYKKEKLPTIEDIQHLTEPETDGDEDD
jgi:hypothetical protein